MIKFSQEEIENIFIQKECRVLSEYKTSKDNITYQCRCGVVFSQKLYNFIKYPFCATCRKNAEEKQRKEYLDNIYNKYIIPEYIGNGKHIPEIAKEFNLHKSTLYEVLELYNVPINKQQSYNVADLTNQRFGKLVAIKIVEKTKKHHMLWLCKCDCGGEKITIVSRLRNGKTRSCGCISSGNMHHIWNGYGEISGSYWIHLKNGAERRNLEFSITIEQAWDLFLEQNRKCALSKLNLKFKTYRDKEITASLDRIDSSKGYIVGNIQWVHKNVNRMKWEFDQDEFINLCKLITENNNK